MARYTVLFMLCCIVATAQNPTDSLKIKLLKGEYWWGGAVGDSHEAPYRNGYEINLYANTRYNQAQPLLVSNKGRVIWCEGPFRFSFRHDSINVVAYAGKIIQLTAGSTLRDAVREAGKQFFPPAGMIPDSLLFLQPQYNTWIELTYNQNEKDIMKYADAIVRHGLPPGVLMIDDNWQRDYGSWEFDPGRFDDPRGMVKRLHAMGFKVMLWICPFVSADSEIYRKLKADNLLLQEDGTGEPAIIRWWNGASAVLDFSNPDAVKWFRQRLAFLQEEYGIDGFKFDAGDAFFYKGNYKSFIGATTPNDHSLLFGKIGIDYPLNEYRAMWKLGGQPLAQRLADKEHTWSALKKLIPQLTAQGLMGYPFTCPDMIGGGEFLSFLDTTKMDQDLVVRSAQCHALMPMMQFSVAPWRVLDSVRLRAVKAAVAIRMQHSDYIYQLAKTAAVNGEPIVRSMEYMFPGMGYGNVTDQFVLGDRIIVAPVLEKSGRRKVLLPAGKWRADDGKIIKGPTEITIDAAIDRLPYFTRTR